MLFVALLTPVGKGFHRKTESKMTGGMEMKIVVVKSPKLFRKILRTIFGLN